MEIINDSFNSDSDANLEKEDFSVSTPIESGRQLR
jgi:hypothetical protein